MTEILTVKNMERGTIEPDMTITGGGLNGCVITSVSSGRGNWSKSKRRRKIHGDGTNGQYVVTYQHKPVWLPFCSTFLSLN